MARRPKAVTTVVTFVRRGRMISIVGVGSTVLQTRVNQTAKKRVEKWGQQQDPSDRHSGYAAMPDRAPRQSDGKLAFQVPHPMPSLPPPPHPGHKQMALQTPRDFGVAAPARRILSGNIAPISEPCWASSRVHRGHRWGNCRRAGDRSLSKTRATRASLLEGRCALKPRACPVDLSGRQRDRARRRRTDLQRTRR